MTSDNKIGAVADEKNSRTGSERLDVVALAVLAITNVAHWEA